MVCFSEQNGRLITTITMKLIEQDTFIDFEENILLQMLHQKLKFNPKDFFFLPPSPFIVVHNDRLLLLKYAIQIQLFFFYFVFGLLPIRYTHGSA